MMALQRFAHILDFYVICLVLLKTLGAFFRCIKIDFFSRIKTSLKARKVQNKRDIVESAMSYSSSFL